MKAVFAVLFALVFSLVLKADADGRPIEYPASFDVTDFETKPWLKEFDYVVVVTKAASGTGPESIQVFHHQKIVALEDVVHYQTELNTGEKDSKKKAEREQRITELPTLVASADGTSFKASTGRDAFEKKGVNHGQKDSWTVTPTGFYAPTFLSVKHRSESYSSGLCGSFFGKIIGAVIRKELCTNMEYAVFFNGGVALHKAIPGTEPKLGNKASGGCVRLPAALAEFLFMNIGQSNEKSPLVNPDGTLVKDAVGNPVYEEKTATGVRRNKWSALVIVKSGEAL